MTSRPFPLDTDARQTARDEIKADCLRRAEIEAGQTGRSMKCNGYGNQFPRLHSDHPGGCANDGSGCVCECHDQIAPGVSLLPAVKSGRI